MFPFVPMMSQRKLHHMFSDNTMVSRVLNNCSYTHKKIDRYIFHFSNHFESIKMYAFTFKSNLSLLASKRFLKLYFLFMLLSCRPISHL